MRKYFMKLRQKYYNTYLLRYSCNDEEAKDLIDFGYKKITRKRALEMVREENRARRFNMPTAGFADNHIYPAYTRRNENTFRYSPMISTDAKHICEIIDKEDAL